MTNTINFFQVDTFTEMVFHGNPAMVCVLPDEWLNDELLKAIASENNLAETAFVVENKPGWHIRWFTPWGERMISGHSTLAAAYVLFEKSSRSLDKITFDSAMGPISVMRKDHLLSICLLPKPCWKIDDFSLLTAVCSQPLVEAYESEMDYLAIMANKQNVLSTQIDYKRLEKSSKRGLIISAQGLGEVDFYSRCFYPSSNIEEDPVTATAYQVLAPFWSARLQKTSVKAIQGSIRRGALLCDVSSSYVTISGHCKQYSQGTLVF